MNKIKIEYVELNKLKPYAKNPRKNDKAVQSVMNSINEFGFKVPIVCDTEYNIINGHTRYKASQKLGLKEVPCIIAQDLTEEQIRAFRIADNKTSELADWDIDLLSNELSELSEFNFEDFGFNDIELMMYTEDIQPDKFDKDIIDEYSQKADEMCLKAGRVIITYENPDEKAFLEELIKEKKDCLKVIYKAKDIINKFEE